MGILAAFSDLDAAGNVGFKKALLCLASTSCSLCQVCLMSNVEGAAVQGMPTSFGM